MEQHASLAGQWALILGASSGFGACTARTLAAAGLNILGVHLDRRGAMAQVARLIRELEASGVQAHFYNTNAADPDKRTEVLDQMQARLAEDNNQTGLKVFMHSLAFGTLKPFIADTPRERMSPAQMSMTQNVMANTLVYWTQDIVARGMMGRGGRIFSMTSAGDFTVIPNYGAVSGAKAALEAFTRQLAVELAPRGITVNALRAGVSDTPALSRIPGSQALLEGAKRRNPHGRLTLPEDVAQAILALSRPGTHWITGNVIGVDGGEDIVA